MTIHDFTLIFAIVACVWVNVVSSLAAGSRSFAAFTVAVAPLVAFGIWVMVLYR